MTQKIPKDDLKASDMPKTIYVTPYPHCSWRQEKSQAAHVAEMAGLENPVKYTRADLVPEQGAGGDINLNELRDPLHFIKSETDRILRNGINAESFKIIADIKAQNQRIIDFVNSNNAARPAPASVTDHEVREAVGVGREIQVCAASWVKNARLLGNVMAEDIYNCIETLIRAATTPKTCDDAERYGHEMDALASLRLNEITNLKMKCDKLVNALEYYADSNNYMREKRLSTGERIYECTEESMSDIAEEALAEYRASQHAVPAPRIDDEELLGAIKNCNDVKKV